MKNRLRLVLNPSPAQAARLAALQTAFAQACNALAPVAQSTRCWNRVGLHHLAYKQMRERFPDLGSQMVCNAIYSVSRACRMVYQHPASPFHVSRWGGKPLPRLQFQPSSPVYFDRHTLSIKAGQASMFTLDGRMRFDLGLSAADEERFRRQRLREIVLSQEDGRFVLTFVFAEEGEAAEGAAPGIAELPEVVVVQDGDATVPHPVVPDAIAPAVQPTAWNR